MIILKKSLTNMGQAYENFKDILGHHYIIDSMEHWLIAQISDQRYVGDIVLHDNQSIDTTADTTADWSKVNTIPINYRDEIGKLSTSANNAYSHADMTTANQQYCFKSYDEFVTWALDTCKSGHATPFNPTENGYTMMIGPNNVHIGKPNEISVSITVYGENNTITYELMICYGGKDVYDDVFFKNSEMFKRAIEHSWTCDDR